MKPTRFSLLLACSVLAPGAGLAQSTPRFEVAVRAGLLVPTGELGPAAPAGAAWHLDLAQADVTPSFELAVGTRWPGSVFGARIVAAWSVPTDVSGFFDCNPGLACPAVLLPSDAEVGSMSVVADLLISTRAVTRIHPWIAVGAGLRRYDYSWPDAPVLVGGGSHSESALALHAGVGFALDLPVGSLQAEVADYWSPQGAVIARATGPSIGSTVRRNAQQDIVVNIGWRVARF